MATRYDVLCSVLGGVIPVLLGCTGKIDGALGPSAAADGVTPTASPPPPGTPAPAGSGTTGAGGPTTGRPGEPPSAESPAPMPLRRLTRAEYVNTVRDLLRLDDAAVAGLDLSGDIRGDNGFAFAGPVGEVDVSRLNDAADAAASLALRNLKALVPCEPATGDDVCARTFAERFGRRAFRRPPTTAELDDLLALYATSREDLGLDFSGAIGQLVRGVLQAPQFIYRWELGPKPARASGQGAIGPIIWLNPHELAARLSYFLWSSMPDDELFAAADGGRLKSVGDLARESRRMLADPRARATLASFHRQWLHLRDDLSVELARAMDAETVRFVEALFGGDGRLETLLLSPVSFVNESLADIYGVAGVAGSELTERTLDPAQRFGVFTHAGFLTNTADGEQSHPVRRGAVLFEQLLCRKLPPEPADVPAPEPPREGLSNRERFAEHSKSECARACHGVLDPLGFAFENYDGLGRYRTHDGGKPVDASGALEIDGKLRSFTGARDLIPMLARSEMVRDCLVTQWARFALGRADAPGDDAALAPARAAFASSQYDLRALLVALTETTSFLNRIPSQGEVIAP